MKIPSFQTEIYFGEYEFTKPYQLSSSDCESMTLGELADAAGSSLEELGKTRFGYTETQGDRTLRTLIARESDSSPDEVVVLGSPIEGIYLGFRTLLEKGDHVVVLTPAYDALLNLADHVTGNVSRWQLKQGSKGWSLDWDALESLVTPKTRLIVVNFPHNPTGFLPSRDDLDRIIAIARKNGTWIFSDEMYRGLEFRSQDRLPVLRGLYEKSLVLGGLSKSYGLPGMRMGWLQIADPELRRALINWKFYTSMCPPVMTEVLGTWALKARDQIQQKCVRLIQSNLDAATQMFSRHPEFHWLPPQAGSISLAEYLPGNAESYCHQLAADKGIVLLPGKFMGLADRYVRFGFGRSNFKEIAGIL